jgi:hypothetical protein
MKDKLPPGRFEDLRNWSERLDHQRIILRVAFAGGALCAMRCPPLLSTWRIPTKLWRP